MLNKLRPGFQFNQYQLLEQIGAGGQAIVWSAEDSQKQDIVAIKFNEVPEEGQEQVDDTVFAQQLKKIITLRHSHILPIYDYGLVSEVRYLVMPYIAGGSLYEKIKEAPIQLAETLRFISEIALALDFLHQNQIIHRDLKPANVLLDLHQHSYLSDFGLARAISNTTQAMHTGRGTPPYSPPEQHKQLVVTARSDIFSFGVMLYELFTGQLPWNGEKMLGMQQLYTKIELPDPREINPDLPPLLKDVLRRITSADPALRPSSTKEVVKMIDYVFGANSSAVMDLTNASTNDLVSSQDASILLDQKLLDWNSKKYQIYLNMTQFALVDLYQKKEINAPVTGLLTQFLLYHSIMYGYHDNEWWMSMTDPRDKASVALAFFAGRNEIVITRVIENLFKDQDTLALLRSKASSFLTRLMELALTSRSPTLSSQLLSGVFLLSPVNNEWNDMVLESSEAALLGKAALQDNELGDQAVRLIGHIRSRSAIDFVIKNADRSRLSSILLEIQDSVGSLPSFVSRRLKLQVFFEWVNQQLTTQPARLTGGYATAMLGSTLGIAAQIYFTYRLPNFLDLARISSSLIQGLIVGFVFSLGTFLSRLVVERFEAASFPLRFGIASIAGAFGMSAALFLFHVLFLNTIPSGFLIPIGCFIIACSYSIGKIIRMRIVKILISTVAVFAAIVGTWGIHQFFSSSLTDLTPLFLYDNHWLPVQIGFTAFSVAVFMGVFGNIPSLKIQVE